MKKMHPHLYTAIQLIIVVAFALFIKQTIVTPVKVLGMSMEPTYHESDRLWQSSFIKPKRFDTATFPSPRNGKRIVKRLIGLPGETVRIENDQLYIDGKPYDEPYLDEFKAQITDGQPLTKDFSLNTIAVGAETVVPEGKFFFLGDNRRKADDSRYFGFVDQKDIYGTIYFHYYPLNKIGVQ